MHDQLDRIEREATILRRILVAVFRQNDQILDLLLVEPSTNPETEAELKALRATVKAGKDELQKAVNEATP